MFEIFHLFSEASFETISYFIGHPTSKLDTIYVLIGFQFDGAQLISVFFKPYTVLESFFLLLHNFPKRIKDCFITLVFCDSSLSFVFFEAFLVLDNLPDHFLS